MSKLRHPTVEEVRVYREEVGCGLMCAKQALLREAALKALDDPEVSNSTLIEVLRLVVEKRL